MRSLLKFLKNILTGGRGVEEDSTGKRRQQVQRASSKEWSSQGASTNQVLIEMNCELFQAGERLRSVEKLLVLPTPEAIREASLLLEEANLLLQRFGKAIEQNTASDADVLRRKIDLFQLRCQRVGSLLEGALRVQWTRMRWIASFTQTYTAAAKTKTWKPSAGSLNLEM
jgi:hypothetical protein